jgi:hypothetical protein
MNKFFRLSTSLLIFLQGLILVLVLFADKIHIPVAFLGRLHPLVLHLPIGFGVFLVLIFVLKKWIDAQAFQEIFRFLLYLTSIFSPLQRFSVCFYLPKADMSWSKSPFISGLAWGSIGFMSFCFLRMKKAI